MANGMYVGNGLPVLVLVVPDVGPAPLLGAAGAPGVQAAPISSAPVADTRKNSRRVRPRVTVQDSSVRKVIVAHVSRRWYRHGAQVVFVGWEPSEQGFYMNVVDLCDACGGTGEVFASEEVCPACAGEGIQLARLMPSNRQGRLTLDELAARLDERGLPFPDFLRADLEADRRANAASLLHDYEEL